jgi:hypothetical protein
MVRFVCSTAQDEKGPALSAYVFSQQTLVQYAVVKTLGIEQLQALAQMAETTRMLKLIPKSAHQSPA